MKTTARSNRSTRPLPVGTIRLHDRRGYQRIKDPDHPLARDGWAPLHRWTLYNHVDGRELHCDYCSFGPLPWKGGLRCAINVDHINDVKGDDRIENLAPSCFWCNLFKSTWSFAFDEWAEAVHRYGHMHPIDRPYPTRILEEELGITYADIHHNIELAKVELA